MILNRFGDQMAAADFDLFIFRVTGDPNDLHPVHQWPRDIERIGGCYEHDIGKVIFHFQIVILECAVLFRIKHFKQSS